MAASADKLGLDNQIAARYAGADLYSDITLRYGDKEFKAHRIVLVSQSGWFADKLERDTSSPKEVDPSTSASPLTLDLPSTSDSDPTLLTHLLTYLYTRTLPSLAEPNEPLAETCLRLLALYDLANRYAVPTLAALVAQRIIRVLDELYAVSRDLLTAAVPLLYDGKRLTAGDPCGLRKWVAGRAAGERLEDVDGCEVGEWVGVFPEFAVDYLEASWEQRRELVRKGQMRCLVCPDCKYSMEVVIKTLSGEQRAGEGDGRKPTPRTIADMIGKCPSCRAWLAERRLT